MTEWGIWDEASLSWMTDPLTGSFGPARFKTRQDAERAADRDWRELNPDRVFKVRKIPFGVREARHDPNKPRSGTFDIATRGGGRETVTGYVLGDYGMKKVRWFWEFTHLPTGVRLLTTPPFETLASAIDHLKDLAENGPSRPTERDLIERYGDQWGMGMKESGGAVGEARRIEPEISTIKLDNDLAARLIGTSVSKTMRGAPTETWVVHPLDDPGAAVLQVQLFKSGGEWSAWTGNFTRARDRDLAKSLATARNGR